jgi:hypothetical protein
MIVITFTTIVTMNYADAGEIALAYFCSRREVMLCGVMMTVCGSVCETDNIDETRPYHQDLHIILFFTQNQDNSVSTMADYGMDDWGLFPGKGQNFQPPIQWVPGATSFCMKRSGPGADFSSPSSGEVEMHSVGLY